MKIAIFSDVHGNLPALESVFRDAKDLGAEKFFCLGDIVGYGAFPKECLDLVREKAQTIVKGNHEEGVINPESEEIFNIRAVQGLKFSRERLDLSDFDFLKTLPSKFVVNELDISLAHGSFSEPSIWTYIEEEAQAKKEFDNFSTRICFIGHTHIPFVFGNIDGLFKELPDDMVLNPKERYMINVGSVGQPRDEDNRASYGILTIGNDVCFDLRRVEYDINRMVAAIRNTNLPQYFAERLLTGS
ncbi:MAG: metallophosphoesterase family protein [Candidatus Magasanikbacteria bacterium]|nr:metallophosphoesterase family protein [Candidatus Magasanikbacteria bacterium]